MLETRRLLLRPAQPLDAAAVYRAIADEEIVRNLSSAPWPYAPAAAEALASSAYNEDEPRLFIFLKGADPELVGVMGLDRMPSGGMELGYWIARTHWGCGYATEAGACVINLASGRLGVDRLVAGHFIDNAASGRVLEKLGFRPTGEVVERYSKGRGGSAPCRMYALTLKTSD